MDNHATHSHPEVQAWLAKHPRFVMHFTPTGASWLNMVERFFRDITDKRNPWVGYHRASIRRGSCLALVGVIVLFVQIGALSPETQHPCGSPADASAPEGRMG